MQVDSIQGLTDQYPVSDTFVGLILLPIVGNAAEHATAVTVAVKDKMDLAIGVAVGSSMQIALLVLPLIIVIGWGMGKLPAIFHDNEWVTDSCFAGNDNMVSAAVYVCQLLYTNIGRLWILTDSKSFCFSYRFFWYALALGSMPCVFCLTPTGQLSHRRRQIALARRCLAHDDVPDHLRGSMVSSLIRRARRAVLTTSRFYKV